MVQAVQFRFPMTNTTTPAFEPIDLAQLHRVTGGQLVPVEAKVGANLSLNQTNTNSSTTTVDGNNSQFMRTSFAGRIFQSSLAGLGAPWGQKMTTAANTFGAATRADNRDAINFELARHGLAPNF
jgi:hypothetical protein